MTESSTVAIEDFSFVRTGPVYRFLARFALTPWQQVVIAVLVAYVPLAVMAVTSGIGKGPAVRVTFFHDLIAQVRLLITLPIYLLAAPSIDRSLRYVVAEFSLSEIVTDRPRYVAIIRSTEGLLDSKWADPFLLVLAFLRGRIAVTGLEYTSWIALDPTAPLTLAGWWYATVSLPIVFFVSGRWLLRFLIWTYYLASVAKLDLHLVGAHADRVGGLGFVALGTARFGYLAFAAAAGFSSKIAMRILYRGDKLPEYQWVIAGISIFLALLILSPVLFLTPPLLRMKREARRQYARLGLDYVRQFESRWLNRPLPAEGLLGSGDIQSLADFAGSFAIVEGMRAVVFTPRQLLRLLLFSGGAYVPLLLTMMSWRELLLLIYSMIK